eukprot:11354284-Alexandrium_andersonii.AAC.1
MRPEQPRRPPSCGVGTPSPIPTSSGPLVVTPTTQRRGPSGSPGSSRASATKTCFSLLRRQCARWAPRPPSTTRLRRA